MWEISVNGQVISFLLSLILGAMYCALYDILRALRKHGRNSYFAVFFEDITFWLIAAFGTFIFLLSRTSGEIRGYVIAGHLIGFVIFRFTLSRFTFKIFCAVFKFLKKIKHILSLVFNKLADVCENFSNCVFEGIKKIFKIIPKKIKKT